MAQAINCNYARAAIRELCQREYTQCGTAKRLPQESIAKVMDEYNKQFSDMKLPLSDARRRISKLISIFNRRWNPQSHKDIFLDVFSVSAWADLPPAEKSEHTIQNCSACRTKHVLLTRSFPDKRNKRALKKEDPVIIFNGQDLLSTASFGKKVLNELNVITEQKFKKPVEDVLSETPQSKLVVKLSSQE
jgi:hypothetical protein